MLRIVYSSCIDTRGKVLLTIDGQGPAKEKHLKDTGIAEVIPTKGSQVIQMKKWLYRAVSMIAYIHDRIMTLNDSFPTVLNDKQMHFLVIGVLGMLLFFPVHIIFRHLIKRGHEVAVSWIYTFTLILVLTFSIEIGQQISHTGTMEFSDIVFGVFGFLFLFAVYLIIRGIIRLVSKLLDLKEDRK